MEDSVLDTQKGYIHVTIANLDVAAAENDSTIFHDYLDELADDPFAAAHGLYVERGGFSTILRGNTILRRATLLRCEIAVPVLTITDNEFRGARSADVAGDADYNKFGLISVHTYSAALPSGATWVPDTRIEHNHIFIPQSAPRTTGYGEIIYTGAIHIAGNEYTTDGNGPPAFRVSIDLASTVVLDRFPVDGAIFSTRYPSGQPYDDNTLTQAGEFKYFNWNNAAEPVGIAVNDATIVEGTNGTRQMVFTIVLSRPSDSAVALQFATSALRRHRPDGSGRPRLMRSRRATIRPGPIGSRLTPEPDTPPRPSWMSNVRPSDRRHTNCTSSVRDAA